MRSTILLLLALCSACSAAPGQHDESTFGVVRVAFGPATDGSTLEWSDAQLSALRTELTALDALGPSWVETSEADADVVVRPFVAMWPCGAGAGGYRPGARDVVVDPDPRHTPSDALLKRAAGHELAHWWTARHGWTGHLCDAAGERGDCHPAITCERGACLLSGDPHENAGGAVVEEDWTPDAPAPLFGGEPAPEDMALFRACLRDGCR